MSEEFALAALSAGVVGNLATAVVSAALGNLSNSPLKRRLTALGVVQASFAERLQAASQQAFSAFFSENPQYQIPEVVGFLESEWVTNELAQSFIELRGPDEAQLRLKLSHYVGVEEQHAPEGWPNAIHPAQLTSTLIASLQRAMLQTGDPALLVVSTQLERIEKVLSDLNSNNSIGVTTNQDKPEYEHFEAAYKAYVASRAGRLTTPGARDLHGVNQDLSVAYISLNVISSDSSNTISAEDFLNENQEICVRGPAGSGKTTLLNWMVMNCNGNQRLDDRWSNLVPFVIPLRRLARMEQGPPKVSRLVEYCTDEHVWNKATPEGWLEYVLVNQRRALIMLDGVDELPQARREQFWEWLEEFSTEYAGNRIIVTSRTLPGTNKKESLQWNPPAKFKDAQLLEMSDSDITAFVNHWHDAVDLSKLDEDDKRRLTDARKKLPQKLKDPANRRIRDLCSTPLLCAMVCVLHWKEEGYLPRYRVEVYDKCCDMLIEARDLKRDIMPPSGPISQLTKHDKEMVLQRLALSMMQSTPDGDDEDGAGYRVEVSRALAKEWVAARVDSFQAEEARRANPSEVLNYLIERTGLLREPAVDLIDFPHRTFQEYLAACAAGAESSEHMLANKADDDQWHETIMLAAGTPTGGIGFGRRLIEALLKRASRHTSNRARSVKTRKTCLALALGCLENLKQHDPALRAAVLSHIHELVPPHNDADAKVLSVAGDAAVAYLSYSAIKDQASPLVAASARALRLIGTDAAFGVLTGEYIADTRDQVLAEIAASELVKFRDVPAIKAYVEDNNSLPPYIRVGDLSLLHGLEGLHYIQVTQSASNLEALAYLPDIDRLALEYVAGECVVGNIDPLKIRRLTDVRSMAEDMGWLSRFENLEYLALMNAGPTLSADSLSGMKQLTSLNLRGTKVTNCRALSGCTNLDQLHIADCIVDDLAEGLQGLRLTQLSIERTRVQSSIGELLETQNQLESLILSEMGDLSSVDFGLKGLTNLSINFNEGMNDLSALSGAENLRFLALTDFLRLRSIDGLQKLQRLETLRLCAHEVSDVAIVGKLASLKKFELLSTHGVYEIDGLDGCEIENLTVVDCVSFHHLPRHLPVLSELALIGLPNLSTLEQVTDYKSLSRLELVNCVSIRDFEFLLKIPSLKYLVLREFETLDWVDVVRRIQGLVSLEIDLSSDKLDFSVLESFSHLEKIVLVGPQLSPEVPISLKEKISFRPYYFYDDRLDYYRTHHYRRSHMRASGPVRRGLINPFITP